MIGKIAGYDVDPKTGFWDISVELIEKLGQTQLLIELKTTSASTNV